VRALPFSQIYRAHETAYYVKVDIEGGELTTIRELVGTGRLPSYLSFEVGDDMAAILDVLSAHGYAEYQVVPQWDKTRIVLPQPPLEGNYVDIRFNNAMSGPFGRELPGSWVSRSAAADEFMQGHVRRARAGEEAAARDWHDIHARLPGSGALIAGCNRPRCERCRLRRDRVPTALRSG